MSTLSKLLLASILASICTGLCAQGSLTPSDSPAPTQKSLQEIWDKIETLQTTIDEQTNQIEALKTKLDFDNPPSVQATVPVGNIGNLSDSKNTVSPSVYGSVDYHYRIGKYEVTNYQYIEFLNSVALDDKHNLYDGSMSASKVGGILRSGGPGSYRYSEKENMGNKPVNFVDWFDAARFCNWLHNGRPQGPQDDSTTESGAYTLNATLSFLEGDHALHGGNGRMAEARYWVPSENEWYKAAYHGFKTRPRIQTYYKYPTRSDTVPEKAAVDAAGNIVSISDNVLNFGGGAEIDGVKVPSTVGSGGLGSSTYYGAYDMGGNVAEITEAFFSSTLRLRVTRGAGFDNYPTYSEDRREMHSIDKQIGFRVATQSTLGDTRDDTETDPIVVAPKG